MEEWNIGRMPACRQAGRVGALRNEGRKSWPRPLKRSMRKSEKERQWF